jgi:hypothetical protein
MYKYSAAEVFADVFSAFFQAALRAIRPGHSPRCSALLISRVRFGLLFVLVEMSRDGSSRARRSVAAP